jgi:membrane protein DedA with SNARE-associated domain
VSLEAARWYVIIFCALFFTGIGVPPVPEEAMIIFAAGVEALHPETRWFLAWPATIAGVICADSVLYWAGRLSGPRLFEYRWVQKVVKRDRLTRLQGRFAQHGIKILLTARLLPPLRTGVFVLAGAIKYPYFRFLAADSAYAIFGISALFFGSTWMVSLLRQVGHWAVYVLAGIIAGYLLVRYYRRLREHESKEGAAAAPVSVLELPGKEGTAEPTNGEVFKAESSTNRR